MPPQTTDLLILAAAIASIPTVAIAAFGFAMRRSGDLSTLLAAREALDKTVARIEADLAKSTARLEVGLREERDKRDKLEEIVFSMPAQFGEKYVLKEDFLRNSGTMDHKYDALACRIENIRSPSSPTPDHC